MKAVFDRIVDFVKENFMMIVVGLIVLMVAIKVWSYLQIDTVTKVTYHLKDQSKINRYYAAQLLLQSHNKQAVSQLDMDFLTLIKKLPSSAQNKKLPSTLIIRQLGNNVNEKNAQTMLDWVDRGGHLITFTHKGLAIDKHDWKGVNERLTAIKTKLSIDKNTAINSYNKAISKAISNDKKLQAELKKLSEQNKAVFWQKLGIYVINNEFIELKDIDKYTRKINSNIRPYVDNFYRYGDGKFIINNVTNTAHKSNQLQLIQSSRDQYLHSELLFSQYPTVKKRTDLRAPTAQQIRLYLTQQLEVTTQLQKHRTAIKKLEKANKQDDDSYLTPAEQQKLLQTMIDLPDATLLKMFANVDKHMLDISYGKGRITVLQDPTIWKNPQNFELNQIQYRKDFLTKGVLPLNWRDNKAESLILDIFNRDQSLYSQDHGSLLTSLTSKSDKLWLFTNINIASLPVTLWKNAKLAVIGLGLVLFVWLWSLYNSFGKRRYLSDNKSVDVFRYFIQIGRYAWGYDHGKKLTRLSQQHTVTLVKDYLVLKPDSQITEQQVAELSQQLQQKLLLILNSDTDTDDQLVQQLRADQDLLVELLTPLMLQRVLLTNTRHFATINANQFTSYTQCLWLIKWLLTIR